MRPRRRPGSDAGAAVVDFVFLSVLLVLLLFAVLQVATYVYARTVISSAAADAARYAATAGSDPAAGGDRAATLIRDGLTARYAASVPCRGAASVDAESGLATTTVHCHGRAAMLLLPLHLPLTIDVTASALREAGP